MSRRHQSIVLLAAALVVLAGHAQTPPLPPRPSNHSVITTNLFPPQLRLLSRSWKQ